MIAGVIVKVHERIGGLQRRLRALPGGGVQHLLEFVLR